MKEIKVYNAFIAKNIKGKGRRINIFKEGTGTDNSGVNPRLTLKVNNRKPDTLEIFVNADKKYRTENSNLFYLFIQTHGIINRASSEMITDSNTLITIPKLILTTGINQITIFDSRGQPIYERFLYTPAVREKQFLPFIQLIAATPGVKYLWNVRLAINYLRI